MANVPIYNEPKVADRHIAQDYKRVNLNADMFGANVLQAVSDLGKTAANLGANINKKADEWNKTKIVDITNQLDSYTNTALYDKDNGYFYKTGSNAMGQSEQVMADYDAYAQELIDNSNLKGEYLTMAQNAIIAKRNKIFPSIQKHDADETKSWQSSVYSQKEANFLNQAILDRNDDKLLAENLAQGFNVIDLQAQLQDWDEATVDLKKKDFASKYHIAVINGLLGDGSLRAKQYYEAHKNDIDPNKHNQILNAVNSNEMKYNSNQLADEFMLDAQSEEEALAKAYKLDNIELADATAARIKQKFSETRRLKNQKENDLIDGFYDVVLKKQQNNQPLTFDDIPDELSSQSKLSLMEYINKNGKPDTDDAVWQQLYYMSVNNAQGFADEDLNKYRGYLSESEFKSFLKRQEDIKSGKYFTQIKDDDKMIKEALKAVGLGSNGFFWWAGDKKNIAYSELRALTREFEARKGRKITDDELLNLTESLGYQGSDGVMIYKLLEQGMRERTGFIRDVVNDFAYFQSKHNELPSNEEKIKIIQQRVNQRLQEQNEDIVDSFDMLGEKFYDRKITSAYGLRKAPTAGASTDHKGLDLSYKMNEQIHAFSDGIVTNTGYDSKLGNFVEIKSDDGVIHRYGHLNKSLVKKGDKVMRGYNIANAGSTGVSTGPHLHYAVLENGKFLNPVEYHNKLNENAFSEKIATDAKGNKALVQVDSQGKIIKVIKEL